MSYDDTVKAIVAAAGGKDNIQNAWHCMTRLRFRIKDEGAVSLEGIGKIPGALGTKFASGQLQVVVGTEVDSYFAALAPLLGLKDEGESGEGEEEEKKGIVGVLMDTVSGIFGPLVPAIAGAGMIKGLMAGLVAIGAISNASDTYVVLDMIASGVFTFLPFFIAYSAARIFKTNPYVAVAIAAAMQYPSMTAAVAAGEIDRFMLFGFLPVPVTSYAGNVIPIILAVWALSYIYRWIDKVLPRAMRTVFTPTISLFIAGILTFAAIGPLGTYLGIRYPVDVCGLSGPGRCHLRRYPPDCRLHRPPSRNDPYRSPELPNAGLGPAHADDVHGEHGHDGRDACDVFQGQGC